MIKITYIERNNAKHTWTKTFANISEAVKYDVNMRVRNRKMSSNAPFGFSSLPKILYITGGRISLFGDYEGTINTRRIFNKKRYALMAGMIKNHDNNVKRWTEKRRRSKRKR